MAEFPSNYIALVIRRADNVSAPLTEPELKTIAEAGITRERLNGHVGLFQRWQSLCDDNINLANLENKLPETEAAIIAQQKSVDDLQSRLRESQSKLAELTRLCDAITYDIRSISTKIEETTAKLEEVFGSDVLQQFREAVA